jgi:DNA-binding transcriptional LysR family regulator
MERFRVVFDAVPLAHWGPLFHVLCCEFPDVRLEWRPVGFPAHEQPLLGDAELGLFLEPTCHEGLSTLTIERSPMVAVLGVGHRLAACDELWVADILDQPFLGRTRPHPEWMAFWTLDAYRGGPPQWIDDDVQDVQQALAAIASGRAIGTFCDSSADGLPHPGLVAIPLRDGPLVTTRLVWESGTENPMVQRFVEIAEDLTRVA